MFRAATIVLVFFVSQTLSYKTCSVNNSIDISNGTLYNGHINYNGMVFTKGDYFIDKSTQKKRGCICNLQPCSRKCCPFGYAYNLKTKSCIEHSEEFLPVIWDKHTITHRASASETPYFLVGVLNCSEHKKEKGRTRASTLKRDTGAGGKLRPLSDGRLHIETNTQEPPWTFKGPEFYCLDTFIYEDSEGNHTSKLDALVCFGEKEKENHYVLTSCCMLVSCVFILATLGVYFWLPELRNLHGRVLMVYLACLFVSFAFLATMQILLHINNIGTTLCMVLSFIIYFAVLSAFFWLNVMCFDIWWTFSGKRGLALERLSTRGRFCAYCCYAFGISTFLTILLAILQFSELPPSPWLPNMLNGCFLYETSKFIYLYVPILFVCVTNMFFFSITAIKIARINQQTAVLKSKDSAMHDQHRNDKQRLMLYIKLFTLMGLSWILEVASAVWPGSKWWQITDAYNVLIGVVIFMIFVCKRKIYKLIKKRYRQTRGGSMSKTNSTNTSSSRPYSFRQEMRMNSVQA